MEFCKVGEQLLEFNLPKIMGILNVTPDSFFDGGRHFVLDKALIRADVLLQQGADILDVGAYSSRPGAREISIQEEIDRLLPVVEGLVQAHPDTIISIDTFRAAVAKAAIQAGAHIINDISGGNLDDGLFQVVADSGVPYILMHSRGNPQTMQTHTTYTDLIADIISELLPKIQQLRTLGVRDVIVDPGFGFAKTLDQNYELLSRIDELQILGLPILGALSRKSMVYKALNIGPEEALNGSTVLHTLLLTRGVKLIRVHDVREAVEVRELVLKTGMYNSCMYNQGI